MDLIDNLVGNAQSTQRNIKTASVMTLGFLTEDLDINFIDPNQMNQVLYAFLSNIDHSDTDLTRIAAKAFSRAAPVTKRNFEVQAQKAYIMEAMFKAFQINDDEILESMLEALVDIGKVAYDYMVEYIQTIGELTLSFINSDKDRATTLAIEFWTSLCEVESERNSKGQAHLSIINGCSESLLPILLQGLSKVDHEIEDQDLVDKHDEQEWTVSLASACALEHIA